MIYLDNAATTFPKPPAVWMASQNAAKRIGANPGRSGHTLSMQAAEEVYRCRETIAEFFHAEGPECVAFTLNCTHAINFVLKGLLKNGDHVVTSCLEHNAVMRPLFALRDKGISFTEADVVVGDNDATVHAFRKALRPNTALLVCTHASNVLGARMPVERLAALGREYGIPILVDCAQSAGVLPIDLLDSGIDYLCMPGHKGLYGPMGTGVLITSKGEQLQTIIEGGTGTFSESYEQPKDMPERLESGTPNLSGIAGLRAGVQFVRNKGTARIFQHEMQLIQLFYDTLSRDSRIQFYTKRPDPLHFVPVLSFNIVGMHSEEAGRRLNQRGIAVRAGLHCAPSAHRLMGTLEQGAVRICPSVFTTREEIQRCTAAVLQIAAQQEKPVRRMHTNRKI